MRVGCQVVLNHSWTEHPRHGWICLSLYFVLFCLVHPIAYLPVLKLISLAAPNPESFFDHSFKFPSLKISMACSKVSSPVSRDCKIRSVCWSSSVSLIV